MSNNWIVREFERDNDYKWLDRWSKAAGMLTPPLEILPQCGYIAVHDYIDCCVGFLYLANSCPVGVVEWVYFNHEINPRLKAKGLKHVVNALSESAKSTGHNVIFASSGFKGVTKIYERNGFQCANSGMSHLIRFMEE